MPSPLWPDASRGDFWTEVVFMDNQLHDNHMQLSNQEEITLAGELQRPFNVTVERWMPGSTYTTRALAGLSGRTQKSVGVSKTDYRLCTGNGTNR